jgi:DNA polymerase III delta subunit
MLYIIYGTDREKGRKRFQALREKSRGACDNEFVVSEGEATEGFLDTSAVSRGLFGEMSLFTFDSILEKKAEQEIIASHAQALAASPNHFLIFEPTLDKKVVAEIAEHATETEECVGKKIDTRPAFNIFSLGDALGNRNKKDLWVLYEQAITAGLEPEEICGTLFWSVKNIALMKSSPAYRASADTARRDSAEADCGLNPFVAKKSRGFAANYTGEEITGLSRSLSSIYHEAHRGGEPMTIALERFILSL